MAEKFATSMLLPAAVLILLSVLTSAEDTKTCYWCGPLAEQVHRSQRAPSCGQELQETTCDPGYTHCAVVATSPPYIESRLCVKFYQDECFSLYCNTTKTWRMICPCQGNLCNGQNTDREKRAFATLTKTIAKNKRSKRCLVGAKGFFPLTPRKKVVIENNTTTAPYNETHSAMQFEDPADEHNEELQATPNDILVEHQIENNVGNNIEDKPAELDDESEMQGDQPIDINEATTDGTQNVEKTANSEHETTKIVDENKINSDASTTAMPEVNKEDVYTVTLPAEIVKETHETTEIPKVTLMIPTNIEIELSVIHVKDPTDSLPPPEALQQNVTPTKVTEQTTMETIEIITTSQIETTTKSIKEITKTNDKTTEAKQNNGDSKQMSEKNGEVPNLTDLWELVIIMNVIVYLAF